MNKGENYDKKSLNLPPAALKKRFEFNFRNQAVVFEIDQLATKSDRSILCRYGNTTVLTVLTTRELTESKNSFFSLTVTFEEKFYAVGRIPGMFTKREGKPSYDAVTAARLIDRSLRSFFPFPTHQEVQITNLILTIDPPCDPRMMASWNSVLVCFLSPHLPYFDTPFATVVKQEFEKGYTDNPNPFYLELIVSATEEKIVMLEAKGREIKETKMLEIINSAQQEIRELIGFFRSIANNLGVKKEKKGTQKNQAINPEPLAEKINHHLASLLFQPSLSWIKKEKEMKQIREVLVKEYISQSPQSEEEQVKHWVEWVWDEALRNWMRKLWKEKQVRLDGRKAEQIRPLEIQIDYLPNVHGSALFARGETKVLSVVTIGKISEKQLVNSPFSRSPKYFIHHYNFPPFAVNEIVSYRAVSRREIGHGELVENTFDYLISSGNTFPYTVRVVSEVLTSDGSSSQAAICATSLALMTAGIPLTRPAAGIALGLFEGQIYTDINGLEDKLGEMDFKIAGTEEGVCSLQLDLKNKGISLQLVSECFEKARSARLALLTEMKKHIFHPRSSLPTQVIKCRRFYVAKEKIGLIVGPGGRTIRQLTEETGSTIEIQDDNCLLIYHLEEKKLAEVWRIIQNLIE
ncbi:MAG: polyribonucleotide nucleotidyltransferase [Candidatus Moeniiplasma glomeromycotorum]|nr:polyribonucleotide nucleotidyltransferase [Candidatus Moeniiplasma glomeromycotorum]MCE8167131.1 polyribonucleotide nucleotidyltransferase [Candidatus Moeniiplasma glomeromycotorum]MCE8168857.1 polyribonucleotide nucleotidyltransferase [Candidatus Moeniiplasma glomeromycotorum]